MVGGGVSAFTDNRQKLSLPIVGDPAAGLAFRSANRMKSRELPRMVTRQPPGQFAV
jgi:hypothetical protein